MALVLFLAATCGDAPREVLCLYDSTESSSAESPGHRFAEVALNYLGLIAVHRDVNEPFPTEAEMRRYRGVLAWFRDSRMANGRAYWSWIAAQARRGGRVVLLGNLGALDQVPLGSVQQGLKALGLDYGGDESSNPAHLEIVHKDPLMEFERTLDRELTTFARIQAGADHAVLLRARRTDRADCEGDLAAIGPRGGFCLLPLHYDEATNRTQWRIDPYAFLARAFGVASMPKPDLATAMGRRILFVSVDGDGLTNRVRAGPNVGRFAGEVVRDRFLRTFDLPVTASVIAADADVEPELVRSILSLPNVEAGAHSYHHPLNWRAGTLAYPGTFSLEKEIDGAIERINALSPKPVKIYLWTGDCEPPPEAIERLDRLGIANMNGEDADTSGYLSLSGQRSVVTDRGGRLQFNARGLSEHHFTDGWKRNHFAYRNVLEIFKTTASPYPMMPLHVYYHYYIVDQPAGELALREVLDWAARQETFPMTASEYAAWVRGFLSARLEALSETSWEVRDYGACRTVRFDGPALRYVDLERSANVLGFRSVPGFLYVHLGEGSSAVVTLSAQAPKGPYLVDSNGAWKGGKIVAQTAARATVMTAEGLRRLSSSGRELPVDAEIGTSTLPVERLRRTSLIEAGR